MDTTTAAAQAGVTTPTIRRWCRYGAVAAVKVAGRWIIEAASLAYRIALGKVARMDNTPTYHVTESTNQYGNLAYAVTRTDGTPYGYGPGNDSRIATAAYIKAEHADIHCAFLNATPAEYRIERENHRRRDGHYWKITGGRDGDPSACKHTWDEGQEVKGNWAPGTTPVDILIHWAHQHAAGADKRITQAAEDKAIAQAEAAVRETRQAQLAEVASRKGTLATPKQVAYILQLLEAREISGEGGGFFTGPTNEAEIEELSKAQASMYITSLKGDY